MFGTFGNVEEAHFRAAWRLLPTAAVAALLLVAVGCAKPAAKVGAVLPLSGPDAALGEAARASLEAAIEALPDTPIELEVVDSGSDPRQAAERAATLMDGGVVALIGGVTPGEARSLAQAADAREKVLILTSASEQALSKSSKWVYRLGASDAEAGAAFATFAANRLNHTSAVVLASDAAYAEAIGDGFEPTFTSLGGEILRSFEAPAEQLATEADAIDELDPDVAVLAGDAAWQRAAAEALRGAGYGGVLFAARHLVHPAILTEAASIDDLLFAYSGLDLEAPAAGLRSFLDGFEARHGRAPGAVTAQVAAEAWDALQVLDLALRDRPAMPSEIRRGLRDQVKSFEGASGSLEFDDSGGVTAFPRVYSLSADGDLRDHGELLDRRAQRIAEERRALQRRLQNLQSQMGGEAGG